jgi:hypothetical protein
MTDLPLKNHGAGSEPSNSGPLPLYRSTIYTAMVEGGFASERFGHLHCVVIHANLQPAVAAYGCQPGDSTWRALAMDVLRIEDGLITEIVTVFTEQTVC